MSDDRDPAAKRPKRDDVPRLPNGRVDLAEHFRRNVHRAPKAMRMLGHTAPLSPPTSTVRPPTPPDHPAAFQELDVVTTTAPTLDGDGRTWPAGTTGAIVDLRTDAATIEVVDRQTGYTLGLLDAFLTDIVPAPPSA